MSKTRISTAIARPARTAVQMAPAAAVTEFYDAFINDLNQQQYAALFAILTLLFGYGQVLFENWKGVAFLRQIPSVDSVPLTDTDPTAPGA